MKMSVEGRRGRGRSERDNWMYIIYKQKNIFEDDRYVHR